MRVRRLHLAVRTHAVIDVFLIENGIRVKPKPLVAGVGSRISDHTFRATVQTANLQDGCTLENVAAMRIHTSPRTNQLHRRRRCDASNFGRGKLMKA